MIIVDIQRRLESALDIVALMIAAETIPVMIVGAYVCVTAIIAELEEIFPSVSDTERAARPRSVGKIAIAAINTADTRLAL